MANTPVSEIRPIKKLQDALVQKYIDFPPDMRENLLKSNREFLEKKRAEKKIFEETGYRPKPSEEAWRALDNVLNEILESIKPRE